MEKVKAGDTLYYEDRNKEIVSCTVTKVGRKYFYVSGNFDITDLNFSLESLKHQDPHYRNSKQLYLTEGAISDKYEDAALRTKIRQRFEYFIGNDITLDQLRAIDNILNQPKI